jgi:hypothetical protein
MAFTQAELDTLKRAYARGVTRVTYDGKTTEYDSGAALLARIKFIEAELAATAGRPRRTSAYVKFTRT